MQALAVIGCAFAISVVIPITHRLTAPHPTLSRPPSIPLIAGEVSWTEISSNHLITAALKDRIDNPTYVPGPSEFFKSDTSDVIWKTKYPTLSKLCCLCYRTSAKNITPASKYRLKFINLASERAKFIIKPVPKSCFLKFFRFECCIPGLAGAGNVAFEADIQETAPDPNVARLSPMIPGKLPDIIEFPIPKKTVYVTLVLNDVPIFEDRKMCHYDTFICREHLVGRGRSISEHVLKDVYTN